MRPGRELDALIAEKVMGWVDNRSSRKASNSYPDMYGIMDFMNDEPVWASDFPAYSTDIAAAFKVVQHVIDDWSRRGYEIDFTVWHESMTGGWVARFSPEKTKSFLSHDDPMDSSNAPEHAICLASLKALGVEV